MLEPQIRYLLQIGFGFGRIVHCLCTVYLFRNYLYLLLYRQVKVIKRLVCMAGGISGNLLHKKFRQLHGTCSAPAPDIYNRCLDSQRIAIFLNTFKFQRSIGNESVDRHHRNKVELPYVFDMLLQILYPPFQCLDPARKFYNRAMPVCTGICLLFERL